MRFLPIGGFVLLLAALAILLITRPTEDKQDATTPFPQISLMPFEGKTAWNQQTLIGHVTLLNFFASWCAPCAAEMPELVALKKTFPTLDLEGVAWNDDAAAMNAFLRKHRDPFRAVWLDPNGEATITLGIQGIPETFIIDTKGVVRYRLRGPLTPDLRAETIDPLLSKLIAEAAHAP